MTDHPERRAAGRSSEVGVTRSRLADERDGIADERDKVAGQRDDLADRREAQADAAEDALRRIAPPSATQILDALAADAAALRANRLDRDEHADESDRAASAVEHREGEDVDWAADRRDFVADDRQSQADRGEVLDNEREVLADVRERHLRQLAADIGLHTASAAGGSDVTLESVASRAARRRAGADRAEARRERQRADVEHAGRDFTRPLASHLLDIARLLVHASDPDDATADIVAAAQQVVPGCDAASFSKPAGIEVLTTATTSPVAQYLDSLQYENGEGPCLEALLTLQLVTSDELAADSRWPQLVAAVAAAGFVASAMASPIVDERDPGTAFGSINNYSTSIGAFDEEARDCVMLLSAHLGAVLTLAARAADADTTTMQLTEAVESRDVIGQAKGILMERQRLTADQAFDVLKRASQRLNRRLRDVAGDLTRTGEIATPPRGPS
jgi:hypothetical protein